MIDVLINKAFDFVERCGLSIRRRFAKLPVRTAATK